MIQTVSIDPADYDTIRQAAHADGIGYADKLANIIADYAKAYRSRQQAQSNDAPASHEEATRCKTSST